MPDSQHQVNLSPSPAGRWYAVYTRSRHEKLVAEQFSARRIENFLPLYPEVHRWKDRYKKVELPLFSGYVFAQFERHSELRLAILKTPGVVRIVGFGEDYAPIPDEQIASLRRVLEARTLLHRHRSLRVGQRVKIVSGALAGVEGTLVRIRNSRRLLISVEPIRQSVSFEVAGYEVVPVRQDWKEASALTRAAGA